MEKELQRGAEDVVKDLAESFGIHSKVMNRTWLAGLLPISLILSDATGDTRELPFQLGTFPTQTFDLILFLILAALIISFASSRAASLIPYELAHQMFDEKEKTSKNMITQRNFFSMLSHPSLMRTGPFSDLANTTLDVNKFWRKVSVQLYRTTKYLAVAIILGLPAYALGVAFINLLAHGNLVVQLISLVFTILCVGCLVYILLVEIKHTERIVSKKMDQILKQS